MDFDSRNIPGADVLVVMMREIDMLGEIVDIAPLNLIEIVDKISSRILKLRDAGFKSVVLGGEMLLLSRKGRLKRSGLAGCRDSRKLQKRWRLRLLITIPVISKRKAKVGLLM